MTLESLKENLKYEKEIVQELFIFNSQLEQVRFLRGKSDEMILIKTIESLLNLMKLTNDSIPRILEGRVEINVKEVVEKELAKIKKEAGGNIEVKKKINIKSGEIEEGKLIRVSYILPTGKKFVTINKEDKARFLKELSLSLSSMKKIKRTDNFKEKEVGLFKKPSFYAKLSNRFFLNFSNSLVNKGYFKRLNSDMRKANMTFLVNTYVSMGLMSAVLGIMAAITALVFLVFLISDFLIYLLIIPLAPLIVLGSFYFYPALEKGDIGTKVDQELPFVVIHMSAIAGSKIEPSQIFKIIALSGEYPHTRQELKKIINQINVYGYDLVNALKNTARSTASKKLAELLNGLATTISSGGRLIDFLEKRSETLLFDYRLERERFTRTAETFMDIYISIVIAAPMILMLMMVLLSITNVGLGLTIGALSFIIVLIVALINVVFLVVLHLKQPSY